MKKLLIITGPQGSGNYLFSKIFARHPEVFGCCALNDEYRITHDQEPFAMAWQDPFLLSHIKFEQYAVTSISCPYAHKGEAIVPKYAQFIEAARDLEYDVKVAIIGRDRNVLQHQQKRVQNTNSYSQFEEQLAELQVHNPVYLSTELLYLYREKYVSSLSSLLDFPVAVDLVTIDKILVKDPNTKYFRKAPKQELDKIVKKVSRPDK